jgi:tetratricopeptide (TPR) repeat protein
MTKMISICLFFLISAINFPALGEEIQGQDVQTLLLKAKKLVTEEKHQEAISQFETILKQFPDALQAKDSIFLLADSYVKLVQPEKAEDIYLFALEKYQDDTTYSMRIHNALAELYISTQQLQKAIKSYHAILKTEPDYTTSLQVFEKIEKLHIAREDYAEAAEIRKELLDIYSKLLEKHITDPSINAFWRVRAQIDRSNFTAENYSLIARLQEQAGKKQEAFSTHRFLTTSFSQSPFAIKSFYSMAEHLSAQGDYTNAVAFYLNSIIRSTTPLLSFRAIGIENREFIDTHNRERLTAAEVSEILGKIYILLNKTAKNPRLQEATSTLLQPCEQAYHLVEQGKFIQAAALYKEIDTKSKEPFNLLARYMIALCYTHNGNYLKTLEILQPFLGNKRATSYQVTRRDTPLSSFKKTLTLFSVELAGTSHFNQGQYNDAEILFRITAPLSPYSRYYTGRSYEFQGRIKEAKAIYQGLLKGGEQYFAEMAGIHLARLNLMAENFSPVSRRRDITTVYAGEDRVTKGNWIGPYGDYLYILCAMAGYFDITGGKASSLFRSEKEIKPGIFTFEPSYRIYTGNPEISACRWITNLEEKKEEFLINPLTGSRRSANWDDQGELYNTGKGPDFFFDIPMPEDGLFLLSLYFLNDPNYYEPNRQHTVYLKDKHTGNILTATEVKDFGRGVYKHFLVSGSHDLTVETYRDLSLNTLLSGVFLDRLEHPLDIPDMLAPVSKKTIRTVEHFRRLSGNWQANVTSWQQQKKEWLALRKQVLLQLNEEIFTADTFILQWILAETSQQILMVSEIKKSENKIVTTLKNQIKQSEKNEELPDMLEQIVFYTLDNNRKNLGEKLTTLYLA